MTRSDLNLPNTLSLARLAVAPLQLYFAWTGRTRWYLGFLVACFVSDAVDGYLARKLKQESRLGAVLDSLADFSVYVTAPVCIWWLWPDLVRREAVFLVTSLLSYLVPVSVGLVKNGRLPSHHTWAAKISVVLLAVSGLVMLFGRTSLPFRICVPFSVLAGIEDIAITLLLPAHMPDVRSFRCALDIRRGTVNRQPPPSEHCCP